MMKHGSTILIAIGIAGAVEGAVFATYASFGAIGADGPNAVGLITIFILHFPGLILADILRLGGWVDTALIVTVGFLQYFVIALLLTAFWIKKRKQVANKPFQGSVVPPHPER